MGWFNRNWVLLEFPKGSLLARLPHYKEFNREAAELLFVIKTIFRRVTGDFLIWGRR